MSDNLIGFGSSIKSIQETQQQQQTQQQRRASKDETTTVASIRDQLIASQRCVIIQKDENGLGLRVSGDNPVFVDSVKSDGAAYRAGVRAGDQIIKVNGTLVTKYNHSEVVNLIKECGSYVALTLYGLKQMIQQQQSKEDEDNEQQQQQQQQPNDEQQSNLVQLATTPTANENRITAPIPANNLVKLEFVREKEKTIRKMIMNEVDYLKKLRSQNAPLTNKNQQYIQKTLMNIKKLEEQLKQCQDSLQTQPNQTSTTTTTTSEKKQQQQRRHLSAENLNFYLKDEKKNKKQKQDKTSKQLSQDETETKKSHSFGQYDHHKIISMESDDEDEECDDDNNGIQAQQQSEDLDATCGEFGVETLCKAGNEFFVNFIKFLIDQRHSLSSTFFYILSQIFKQRQQDSRRNCFSLLTTFLLQTSPLNYYESTQDELSSIYNQIVNEDKFDEEKFRSQILKPFEEKSKQIVSKLIEAYKKQQQIGLGYEWIKPSHATFTHLYNSILNDYNYEYNGHNMLHIYDQLLLNQQQQQQQQSVSQTTVGTTSPVITTATTPNSTITTCAGSSQILAQLISLTTIIKHLYSQFLTKDLRKITCFFDSTPAKQQQRHKSSLTSSSSITNSFICGHFFLDFSPNNNKIIYCSGCGAVIWANLGKECHQCELKVHYWCAKMAAEENFCLSHDQQQQQSQGLPSTLTNLASSSSSASRKQRTTKWRTSGGRIVDNILKGLTGYSSASSVQHSFEQQQSQAHSEQHSPPLISSESDSESESNETTTTTTVMQGTATATTPTGVSVSVAAASVTITRSESLKQRRKEAKQFYRKRSDPTTDRSNNAVDESPSVGEEAEEEKGNEEEDEYENPPEPNIPPPPPPPEPFGLIPPPLPPRNKNNKRSEIVRELFETEKTHVRTLRIMNRLFYRPIVEHSMMTTDQISLVFGNLGELLEIHTQIHDKFKTLKKQIKKEDAQDNQLCEQLLEIFTGELGRKLENEASRFCSMQMNGGQLILKQRIKKDSKLSQFLNEAQSQQICKRLQLKDMLASCFQRITKYPLLFESFQKATPFQHEKQSLQILVQKTKEILTNVNRAIELEANQMKLSELQKLIFDDSKRFLNQIDDQIFNVKDRKLIYEGDLTWRITKQKTIDAHMILFNDYLFILTKDDHHHQKYSLKIQVNPITKIIHQPVLKVEDLLLKNLATDARAFFIVSTKENALLEFIANTINERKLWTQHIQTCVQLNLATTKIQLNDLTKQQPQTNAATTPQQAANNDNEVKEKNQVVDEEEKKDPEETDERSGGDGGGAGDQPPTSPQEQQEKQQEQTTTTNASPQQRGRIEGTIRFVTSEDEEEELIHDPNEIQVNQIEYEHALKIITNEQKMIQLNNQMRELLHEKQRLLNVIKVENEWNEEKVDKSDRKMALLQKSLELCSLLCDDEEKEKKLTFLKEFKQEFEWFVENEEKSCIYF